MSKSQIMGSVEQVCATSASGEKSSKHICEANICENASRGELRSALIKLCLKFVGKANKVVGTA